MGAHPQGASSRAKRARARAVALVGPLMAILALGLVPIPARGVPFSDGGFESGSLAGPFFPPMPYAFGYWEAEMPEDQLTTAPAPVHSGVYSAIVDTMNASNGGVIIQDFDSGTASYVLSFWVYPEAGLEGGGLVYNWDRGLTGRRDTGTAFGWSTTSTGLVAWDTSVTLAPVAFGAWHRIEVVADKCTRTQTLSVDGVPWGNATASPGAIVPSGNATLYFGDGAWIANHGRFYWDDFAIAYWDCATAVPPDYRIMNASPAGAIVVGLSLDVPLSVEVRNEGGTVAQNGSASVLAFANGTSPASPYATFSMPPLGPSASAGPYTATWRSPATPGRYTVTAFADATGVVDESDEANNAYAWTIDVVPGPATALLVGAPNYTAGPTYVTSRTHLQFAVLDPGGSGILRTMSRVDSAPWAETPGAFALAYEGTRHLEWYSEDRAGNVESVRSATLVVDNTPPSTSLAPAGDTFPATASFSLSATDGASGVDRTQVRIDDGDWTTYTAPFRLAPGTHRVRFRSVDHLENAEPDRERILTIAAEANWKPLIAALFALVLAGVGAWSSRRAPLAVGGAGPSVLKAFAATVLPFAATEAVTGIVSLLTGLLSIPPIVGAGTVVDLGILIGGLTCFSLRVRRSAGTRYYRNS